MNNKFFKKLIVFTLFVFAAGMLSACGEKSMAFNDAQITLAVGVEIDMSELVELKGYSLGDIKFESSDGDIVYITPTKKLVTKNKGVAVITAYGISNEMLEVTVEDAEVSFDVPTNLKYDEGKNSVVWDVVYAKGVVAINYEVTVTSGEGENKTTKTEIVNTNSYEIKDSGKFSISVACCARGGVGASLKSDDYTFQKLPAPTNITYAQESGILSWDSLGEGVGYRVKVNGVSDTVNTNQYQLNTSAIGTYTISVATSSLDDEADVFGATSTAELKLTRLIQPDANINDGVITWADTQRLASTYRLEVSGRTTKGENISEEITVCANSTGNYSYGLENIDAGLYNVTIRAIGNANGAESLTEGDYFLDGEQATINNIEKLKSLGLTFNKDINQVVVADYSASNNYNLTLSKTYSGNTTEYEIGLNGRYNFGDNIDAGVYEFSLVNCAKGEKQINSDPSKTLRVIKLGINADVYHGVELNKYLVGNYEVDYAEEYNIKVYKVSYIDDQGQTVEQFEYLTDLEENNNNIDELFAESGVYAVKIIAKNMDSEDTFYIEGVNDTALRVVRPVNCTPTNDTTAQKVAWESVGNYSNIVYEYSYSGASEGGATIADREFSYSNLPVGTYHFEVRATANGSIGENTIILDSLSAGEVTFEVYKDLNRAELSLSRDGDKYYLNIAEVDNATAYAIYCNDSYIIDSSEALAFEITDIVSGVGGGNDGNIFSFKVIARNPDSIYYIDSTAQLDVARALAPESFILNENEDISCRVSDLWYSNTKIFITNNDTHETYETNKLSDEGLLDAGSYTVEIKYVADISVRVNSFYYVDSNIATFTLERADISIDLENYELVWDSQNAGVGFAQILTLTQNGVDRTLNMAQPRYDLFKVEESGFNISNELNISIQFVNRSERTVSGNEVFYISSQKEFLSLISAETLNLSLSETDSYVEVTFDKDADATYTIYGANEAKYDAELFTTSTSKFAIKGEKDGKISAYLFTAQRVGAVERLNIDADENISATLPAIARELVVTINGSDVDNLGGVGTTRVSAYAHFVARENNGYRYYLDGEEMEFLFERIRTFDSQITIQDDKISWDKENDGTDDYIYEIRFFDEDGLERKLEFAIDDTITLNLTQAPYADIIYNFLGDSKKFAIKKVIGARVVDDGEVMYLSSEYSNPINLNVLKAPTDLKVSLLDDDYAQNNLKIEWNVDQNQIDSGNYEISEFVLSIYKNGILSDTINCYTYSNYKGVITLDDAFIANGVWTATVKAVGNASTISSQVSEEAQITRLRSSASLSITKQGKISWSEVSGAQGYVLVFKDTLTGGSTISATEEFDAQTFEYQLTDQQLQIAFSGGLQAWLYALGDGEKTLSSVATKEFTRLDALDIAVTNYGIIIQNYNDYDANTRIYLKAEIDGETVISTSIEVEEDDGGNHVWYFQDARGRSIFGPAEQNRQVTFTLYATNNVGDYFDSNLSKKSAEILANLTDVSFIRNANGLVQIETTNPDTAIEKTSIKIDADTYISDGELEITEQILAKISSSWSILARAVGGAVGDTVYIDSDATAVSGTKLMPVGGLGTRAGVIVWNAVANAVDYRVLVDNSTTIDGHGRNLTETLSGSEFAAITHILNIKALGNVGDVAIRSGIVLDGNYMENSTSVTKLAQIENINVNFGYFTFDKQINADQYMAVIYSDEELTSLVGEYPLTIYSPLNGTESLECYYNEALTELLANGEQYYVQFYAKSNTSGNINSDLSVIEVNGTEDNYLKISMLPQNNEIELWHPEDSGVVDYATTIATLKQSEYEANGFIAIIDGNYKVYFNSSDNEITLGVDDLGNAWSVGRHYLAYAQFGSSGIKNDRSAYLSAEIGDAKYVTKLSAPVVSYDSRSTMPNDNYIYFSSVAGADAYYCYLGSTLFSTTYNAGDTIDLSMLSAGDYESMSAIALSTNDLTYLASNASYLSGEEANLAIKKLPVLAAPTVSGGTMYWEFGLSQLTSLNSDETINSPFFTSKSLMTTQKVEFKFTNTTTNAQYEYIDSITKYMHVSASAISTMRAFGYDDYADTLEALSQNGFPYINYNFKDFATSLPAGEYEIRYRLLGTQEYEGSVLISSEYSNPITKYIAGEAQISIENIDDEFMLKFDNVNVNSSYFGSGHYPVYLLYGVYKDDNGKEVREEVAKVTAEGINNAEAISFNLTTLVNNGTLTSKYIKLGVYVEGNDTYRVLNGRSSNELSVKILDEMQVYVEHGIIKWYAQDGATKYVISYGDSKLEVRADDEMIWTGSGLTTGADYAVAIYAYGTQEKKVGASTAIISGKLTSIGTVRKLDTISGSEENGIGISYGRYTWTEVSNASGYDVYINDEFSETIYNASYETTVVGAGVNDYSFVTVGTESGDLNSSSVTYVNSTKTAQNHGKRILGVTNFGYSEGLITWEYSTNEIKDNIYFVLKFTKAGGDTVEHNVKLSLSEGSYTFDTNDYPDLRASGTYIVSIQACESVKTLASEGADSYLLISEATVSTYYKLPPVEDIRVSNGEIYWEYDYDEVSFDNTPFYFLLEFECEGFENRQIKVDGSSANSFVYTGIVYEDDVQDKNISMTITVIPGTSDELSSDAIAKSVTVTYENPIKQYTKINEETIGISITDNGLLKVEWEAVGGENSRYEVRYGYQTGNLTNSIEVDSPSITFDSSVYSADGGEAVIFQIRVIPRNGAENFISSAWTDETKVEKPSTAENLVWDSENYIYTWDRYDTQGYSGSSIGYKIKDEVYSEYGVLQSTYIIDANIGDETYTPFEVGMHNVSVSVVVRGASGGDLMSNYCEPVQGEFYIFDSGLGTENNPYLIDTAEQFANINFRLNKDSKLSEIWICGTDGAVPEQRTAMGNIYYFKQTGAITITNSQNIKSGTAGFGGRYNGDGRVLELNWLDGSSNTRKISIFEKIGNGGVVENVIVMGSLPTFTSESYVALLAYENYGTIQNVVVGKTEKDISITNDLPIKGYGDDDSLTVNISIALIAYSNYGTIQNIENFYNIDITSSAVVNFATIAINNYGKVAKAKNYGNISVNAGQTVIGGLVGINGEQGEIIEGANVGDIYVYLKDGNRSTATIGGLVARKESNASVSYCYSVCDITVSGSGLSADKVFVGGLIGNCENDRNITYSYTNVTKNTKSKTGSGNNYNGIYQVIGKLSSPGGATSIYYANNGYTAVNGSASGYTAYSTLPVNALNAQENKFTEEGKLSWEETFESKSWTY